MHGAVCATHTPQGHPSPWHWLLDCHCACTRTRISSLQAAVKWHAHRVHTLDAMITICNVVGVSERLHSVQHSYHQPSLVSLPSVPPPLASGASSRPPDDAIRLSLPRLAQVCVHWGAATFALWHGETRTPGLVRTLRAPHKVRTPLARAATVPPTHTCILLWGALYRLGRRHQPVLSPHGA